MPLLGYELGKEVGADHVETSVESKTVALGYSVSKLLIVT